MMLSSLRKNICMRHLARRALAVLLAFALSDCVHAPARPRSIEDSNAAWMRDIAATSSDYQRRVAATSPLTNVGFGGGGCGSVSAYGADEVRSDLSAIRNQLVAIAKSRSEALVNFIEKSYPPVPEQDSTLKRCFGGIGAVRADELRSVWSQVNALFGSLKSLSAIVISFRIASKPTDAKIVLRAASGRGTPRWETTNAQLPNVYRGLYSLDIELPGYKPINAWPLDLVQTTPRTVECRLQLEAAATNSTCASIYDGSEI